MKKTYLTLIILSFSSQINAMTCYFLDENKANGKVSHNYCQADFQNKNKNIVGNCEIQIINSNPDYKKYDYQKTILTIKKDNIDIKKINKYTDDGIFYFEKLNSKKSTLDYVKKERVEENTYKIFRKETKDSVVMEHPRTKESFEYPNYVFKMDVYSFGNQSNFHMLYINNFTKEAILTEPNFFKNAGLKVDFGFCE